MSSLLPKLYAIVDPQMLPVNTSLRDYARELISAGVSLLQFRDKRGNALQTLSDARELRHIASGRNDIKLVMNDRADLAVAAAFEGVHLGQEDLSPTAARSVCKPPMIVGVSTHYASQVSAANLTDCDYIAIGPVFSTGSKQNPDPMVGLEGVRAARALTGKPLVAIGGITAENAKQVMDAGADSVAVISALIHEPRKSVEAFLRVLG